MIIRNRGVVSVATGPYVKGQDRLRKELLKQGVLDVSWRGMLPPSSPTHEDVPYAFKAVALKKAQGLSYDTVLWADACILPIKPLGPLFDRIEQDGYWFSNNGWTNYEWTADSAYPDLFPECFDSGKGCYDYPEARDLNRKIPHVVATCFGISLRHPKGISFIDEYWRLATQTKAFCGPWINASWKDPEHPNRLHCATNDGRVRSCGPSDVRGHRHDQMAASVIAWRLGFKLTNSPDVFAYAKFREDGAFHVEDQDSRTIVCANGRYA